MCGVAILDGQVEVRCVPGLASVRGWGRPSADRRRLRRRFAGGRDSGAVSRASPPRRCPLSGRPPGLMRAASVPTFLMMYSQTSRPSSLQVGLWEAASAAPRSSQSESRVQIRFCCSGRGRDAAFLSGPRAMTGATAGLSECLGMDSDGGPISSRAYSP